MWTHLLCQLHSLRVAACGLSGKVCWDLEVMSVTPTVRHLWQWQCTCRAFSSPHLKIYIQSCELVNLIADLQMRKLHHILFQTQANSKCSKSELSKMAAISYMWISSPWNAWLVQIEVHRNCKNTCWVSETQYEKQNVNILLIFLTLLHVEMIIFWINWVK